MDIESPAPTRIDLAGGTLDIWPLYQYHDAAQLNAAIRLRARCSIRNRDDRRIVIVTGETGRRADVGRSSELRTDVELQLLGRLLDCFGTNGLEIHTRSESPMNAGIDALLGAARAAGAWGGKVCGAGARLLDFQVDTTGLRVEPREAAATVTS